MSIADNMWDIVGIESDYKDFFVFNLIRGTVYGLIPMIIFLILFYKTSIKIIAILEEIKKRR